MSDDMKDNETQITEDELKKTEQISLEEVDQENEEAEKPTPVVDKEKELAISNGWVNKEEWVARGNDPEEWTSAKKFNEKARMIASIKRQQTDIDNLKKYHELQQKQMKIQALEEAKQELQQAREDEDFEAYEAANKKYTKAELEITEAEKIDLQQAEQEFIERNKDWLDMQNKAQVDEILAMIPEIVEDYPRLSVRERMLKLERRYLDNHPEFKNLTNNASDRRVVNPSASAVNKNAMTSSSNSKFNELPNDLKNEYASMRQSLERQGIPYTKEEYVQGLKDGGFI